MSPCPSRQGNSPMYGLGLRLSYYIQWFTLLFSSATIPLRPKHFLHPSHLLSTSLLLFRSATFLALLINASRESISSVDIYIMLLLTYATYYAWIPLYLWRVVSCGNPFLDPMRWPRVRLGGLVRRVDLGLFLAVTGFLIWFWGTGVDDGDLRGWRGEGRERAEDCDEFGFFLTKVPLRAGLFVAVNIFFPVALVVCVLVQMAVDIGFVGLPRWMRKRERRFERELDRYDAAGEEYPWMSTLQFFQAVSNVIVSTVVIVAIELTIQWNHLADINDVSTASQLIPLFIAGGLLLYVLYVLMNPDLHKKHKRHRSTTTSDKSYESSDLPRPGRPYFPPGGASGVPPQ